MPDNSLISVGADAQQFADVIETLAGVRNGAPRAINAAINRTLTTGRSNLVKRVRQEIKISASDFRDAISLKKSSFSNLSGSIRLSRKRMPLSRFSPVQEPAGASVLVRMGAGRQVLKHTFLATMKSGHLGVFERIGAKRLPIRERYGPTIVGVVGNMPGLLAEETAKLDVVFAKNLSSQIDRLTAKQKPDETE